MIGIKIMDDMTGSEPMAHTFLKKNKAVSLGEKSAVKVGEESLQVDPQLMF